MAVYEGDLEGVHFVVLLDEPQVASCLRLLRRGEAAWARQARQPVVDAAVALAYWRYTGLSESLPVC